MIDSRRRRRRWLCLFFVATSTAAAWQTHRIHNAPAPLPPLPARLPAWSKQRAVELDPRPDRPIAEDSVQLRSEWIAYRRRTSQLDDLPGQALPAPLSRPAVAILAPQEVEVPFDSWLADKRRSGENNDARTYFITTSVAPIRATSAERPLAPDAAPQRQTSALASDPLNSPWPYPTQLVRQLDDLAAVAPRTVSVSTAQFRPSSWQQQVRLTLEELVAGEDPQPRLDTLDRLAEEALALSIDDWDYNVWSTLTRTAWAVKRRAAIWQSVHDLRTPETQTLVTSSMPQAIDRGAILAKIDDAAAAVAATGDAEGWNRYLNLDALRLAAQADLLNHDDSQIVRTVLDRVTWRHLSEAQLEFLASAPIAELAAAVQPLAISPIDYTQLLVDFETLEQEPLHRCGQMIASALSALRYSDDPRQIELADAIATHYCNANIRVALAGDLIKRYLPEPSQSVQPIRSTILGADTTGRSQVDTDLTVELIPNAEAWQLRLNLSAAVLSQTASRRWPAVVGSRSASDVETHRVLTITPQELAVDGTTADVRTRDQLTGLKTDFDAIPLVSDFVRYLIDRQVSAQRPTARQITRRMVEQQTDTRFDAELSSQLDQARQKLADGVQRPLHYLGIDADIVELATTDQRLIGRYRVAPFDALAAFTPRPLAPADSLASVQLHQSAINNACNQLSLAAHPWRVPELLDHLRTQLGLPVVPQPEGLPADVEIAFDRHNPISVALEGDRAHLTLRVERLSEPNRLSLHNFVIRVQYALQADGLEAKLVKTGPISVDGQRLAIRDRLPLRTIFGRVFATYEQIPVVGSSLAQDQRLTGLQVGQFTAVDGWLALAITPAE